MKKLCLLLCPIALMALGTSAHAGNYQSVPADGNGTGFPQTYYAGPAVAAAVSVTRPIPNPNNPTGPKLGDGSARSDSGLSGLSQKTWEWNTDAPLTDPARSEKFIAQYSIACTPYAEATPLVSRAQGTSRFTFETDINEQFSYYDGYSHGSRRSEFLPPNPAGQPVTQWTGYSSSGYHYPYQRADGTSCVRVQASAAVNNEAYISGADEPESARAVAGEASTQILDFDCPDAHLAP